VFDPTTFVKRTIALQYNRDTLSRSYQMRGASAGRAGASARSCSG